MKKRLLGVFTFAASCSTVPGPTMDAGSDAGTPDAGRSDAGTDAGYDSDAGTCPCFTDAGVCKVPADYPAATQPAYVQEAICECVPNNSSVFCFFETDARCEDWACRPGKTQDGGLMREPDGGVQCLCFV